MRIFFALILFTSIHAQNSRTKDYFFNLPIDKTKADLVATIKSDTVLFHVIDKVFIIDGKERRNPNLMADIKKFHYNLPKPCKYPHLTLSGAIFYRYPDTLPYKSYNTIILTLTYKRKLWAFKNAQKAFSSIIKSIESEYKIKLEDDAFVGKNKTTFKDDLDDDPRCSVEIGFNQILKNNRPDKSKCSISLTYRLREPAYSQ